MIHERTLSAELLQAHLDALPVILLGESSIPAFVLIFLFLRYSRSLRLSREHFEFYDLSAVVLPMHRKAGEQKKLRLTCAKLRRPHGLSLFPSRLGCDLGVGMRERVARGWSHRADVYCLCSGSRSNSTIYELVVRQAYHVQLRICNYPSVPVWCCRSAKTSVLAEMDVSRH